ncbi:amidohydrolase family protein [Mesorhizobium sp. NBSH29]|uniref:amidohydrolase family protein n=1 Tax=Mesorhizobium sp. NBSH29 TaxID=2654249 RepID=UPI0018966B4F|nr:amidohydrolase family protein [Mesorhizobium sp. NBSH29]QPC86922.1 amidohydrolase family protein [Mesorhizobium sp. NBSH29]
MKGRVDAHQHYWNVARADYDWMPRDHPVLSRNYLPADLAPVLAEAGISRTVLVQAAATVEETEYLLGLSDATTSIAGVVGWIDFEDRRHLQHLQRLKHHPNFLGVRPMIQDIVDDDWMLRDDVQWAYAALVELDLTFDALGFSRHLPNFLTLLRRYPKLRVVVDHCMKPPVRDHGTAQDAFSTWAEGMSRIAAETSACCKLSGLVTEAGDGWSAEDLRPYVSHVLAAFGATRVMWGSDWPVCLLNASYEGWLGTAEKLTAHLPEGDRMEIFGGTAQRFYRLAR